MQCWSSHGLHQHCFNPFFIRASVYCAAARHLRLSRRAGFNPFFIRASVYCAMQARGDAREERAVSIPSSSGHQFTECSSKQWKSGLFSWFQSLLHQGISLLFAIWHPGAIVEKECFNPFFIRASVYCRKFFFFKEFVMNEFQSLLHQGISLLKFLHPATRAAELDSFNPFFIRASVYWQFLP